MERAKVLDWELQKQLVPYMKDLVPLPGVYDPLYIAANQEERADNLIKGTRAEQTATIRQQIRDFKASSGVDKVVILWTANTERYSEVGPRPAFPWPVISIGGQVEYNLLIFRSPAIEGGLQHLVGYITSCSLYGVKARGLKHSIIL